MSDAFNFFTGQIAATSARNDANRADSRAHDAEMEALAAKEAAARATARAAAIGGNSDLERKVRSAQADKALAEDMNAILMRELKAKDELILEWRHTNEAFKQLARQYGKKLGMTDEERGADFEHKMLDIAEDDPKFAATKIGQEIRNAPRY